MSQFLILEFRNAGLFRKDPRKRSKDKMFDMGVRSDRYLAQEYVEPITVNQMSNVLHVLMGERPKPSLRYTPYDRVERIYNIALESYIKIDSPKNSLGQFYSETVQLKKAVGNSWNPQVQVSWLRLQRYLGDEFYTKFINVIVSVFKVVIEDVTTLEIRELCLNTIDKRLDKIFELAIEQKLTPLSDYFRSKIMVSTINATRKTPVTVVTCIDKIIRLNGQLIVPVSDEDIQIIRNNKGCATILDGGIVYIKGLKSANLLNVDGFTQFKNISLKMQ